MTFFAKKKAKLINRQIEIKEIQQEIENGNILDDLKNNITPPRLSEEDI